VAAWHRSHYDIQIQADVMARVVDHLAGEEGPEGE